MVCGMYCDTPVGSLLICEEEERLVYVGLTESKRPKGMVYMKKTPILREAKNQLKEYFLGERKEFTLDLAPIGTAFQEKVWQSLLKIPYGETVSYRTIAAMSGNERATRAVGNANGKNPIMIIIPCHRVIHADGTIGGYSSGVAIKKKLLALEKKFSNETSY